MKIGMIREKMTDEEKNNKNWFSRQSIVIKSIITLFGVCCIGLIVLFAIGSMMPDSMIPGDSSQSKLYENEYISFKYPKSFVDVTFFYHRDDGEYIFFSMFQDSEQNGLIVSSKEIDDSLVQTYLDEYYENLNAGASQRSNVKNFTSEKIDFNGIPAVKVTDEYYEKEGKYGIFLIFVHNKKEYTFYLRSNDLNTLESNYELFKSSILLKNDLKIS